MSARRFLTRPPARPALGGRWLAVVGPRDRACRHWSAPARATRPPTSRWPSASPDDRDLGYDRRDYERFRQLYTRTDASGATSLDRTGRDLPEARLPLGPRPARGLAARCRPPPRSFPTTERLAYGKAFVYPLFAARRSSALGGLGGMLVFNVLLLAVCVWCAVRFCQAQIGRVPGAVLGSRSSSRPSVPVFARG